LSLLQNALRNTMPAELLPTHTPQLFDLAVERAASLLRAGEVVALPTETVYGLAANALNAQAVARIFEIKGRPSNNPIIVHVASQALARQCVVDWPPLADKLARAFWPGPLTVVLPCSKEIPQAVTACGPTVGVRWPSHPFIQAVIRACGFPLAAPSANLSNQLSPTNAEHVRKALADKIPLIVDGGQSQVGIESTVLDLSVTPPRILRPGMIHSEAILAVVGELTANFGSATHLKSPGLLPKHYSPRAKLVLLAWQNDEDLRRQLATQTPAAPKPINKSSRNTKHATCRAEAQSEGGSRIHLIAHTLIPSAEGLASVSVIPHDPEAFGRAIYAELHRADEADATLIVIEALPEGREWQAIKDRLNRASA
jgi:L-threonylcarbamoyladenylate synthase